MMYTLMYSAYGFCLYVGLCWEARIATRWWLNCCLVVQAYSLAHTVSLVCSLAQCGLFVVDSLTLYLSLREVR
jgi:hypothetical protein